MACKGVGGPQQLFFNWVQMERGGGLLDEEGGKGTEGAGEEAGLDAVECTGPKCP